MRVNTAASVPAPYSGLYAATAVQGIYNSYQAGKLKIGGDIMVDRTEAQGFEEFKGKVESVTLEPATEEDRQDQYHIVIEPIDVEVTGKTGRMHDWIRVTKTTTNESVPLGSVIDAYIKAIERIDSSVKKEPTVSGVFKWLVGKTFKFNQEKLGKAFGDHPAADYWVPVKIFTEKEGK